MVETCFVKAETCTYHKKLVISLGFNIANLIKISLLSLFAFAMLILLNIR